MTRFSSTVSTFMLSHFPHSDVILSIRSAIGSGSGATRMSHFFKMAGRRSTRPILLGRLSALPTPSFPAEALSLLSIPTYRPETPGRFSLRLDVYPPPQVLQIVGRLYHLVLAFPYVGDIANGRATSLHEHYSASSLLRARPTPSRLRPTSRFRRLYGLPCSDDFAPGRGGLLQLLSMSLSPCCRFHPAEVNIRIGQSSAAHAAFALRLKARPSGILIFEATMRSLLLRLGDS